MKKLLLILLLLMAVLALPCIFSFSPLEDNFDDNSVNATIWSVTGCTETTGKMVCSATASWGRSNDLYALLGFNSSGDYFNLSLQLTGYALTSGERNAFMLQNVSPANVGGCTTADARGPNCAGLNRFGIYMSNPNNYGRPIILGNVTEAPTSIYVNDWYNFIHNSSGYFILKNGARYGGNVTNQVGQELLKYFGFGDYESDQITRGVSFDNFKLSAWEPETISTSISLSTDLSSNINTTSTTFLVNFTATNSSGASIINNCSLYLNNTLNETKTLLNLTTTQNFTLDFSNKEDNFAMNVTCWNYDNSSIIDSFSKTNIFVDTISPEISISSNFINNSVLYKYIDLINVTTTYTDTNLFAANLTIFKLNNDTSINTSMNNTFILNINTTSYNLNFSDGRAVDIGNNTNYVNGQYKVFAEAWDSHTAKEIKDYKIDKLSDGLLFEDKIKIRSPDIKDSVTTKKGDKYGFDFRFISDNPFIEVECNDLKIPKNSNYKGHIVCFEEKKWLDFESDVSDVQIIQTGNNTALIKMKVKSEWTSFNSIGDLNYKSATWFFNISGGYTFTAQNYINMSMIDTFNITINTTPEQFKTATAGGATFNITSGSYMVTFRHENYTTNATVINFSVGNSKVWNVYPKNSFWLYVYDEETNLPLNVSTYANMIGAVTSVASNNSNGSLFIQNLITGQYRIDYWASGYRTRSFFVTVNNDFQNIYLYTVKNDTSSLIQFEVKDEKGLVIQDAYLKAQRYMVNDSAYKVIGMEQTDSNGQTGMYLVPYDVPYILIVEKDGVVIFRSSANKIYSATISLSGRLLPDVLESYRAMNEYLTSNISWNNNTKLVTYFFNDGSGLVAYGCLQVKKNTQLSSTLVNETCVASNSATIQINISDQIANNTDFSAMGYVHTNTAYTDRVTDRIDNFGMIFPFYQYFGNVGLFLGYIFIITMFFVGLPLNFGIAVIYTLISMLILNTIGFTFFGLGLLIAVPLVGLFISKVLKE